MMSGREFFIKRYAELGWKYRPVKLKQAIRINSANTGKNNVVKRLESLGVRMEKIPFLPQGYWITKSAFSVGATAEYLLGLYSIQEAAAQIPALLFTDLKKKLVLDACAAPGGKTVQLADLMDNSGVIVALDIKQHRLVALTNHLERCNVKNTIVYHMNARSIGQMDLTFDKILLDVPCSGNFASDPKWFNRRTIEDIQRNANLQRQIMTAAVKVLRQNGELVYSTCSLEPEENELNIDWAIRNLDVQVEEINSPGENASTKVFGKNLDNSISKCKRIWPDLTQGFFVCKIRRRMRT